MKKESIVFILPSLDNKPIGGFKMVYEYANRFVDDGWEVYIVYLQYCKKDCQKKFLYHYLRWNKNLLIYIYNSIFHRIKHTPNWFNLDSRIIKKYLWKLDCLKLKNTSDVKYVASSLMTAFELNDFSRANRDNLYYFVQDFESWGKQTPEMCFESYKLPLKKITITPWLESTIKQVNNNVIIIENGLDFNYFRMTNPIENRNPYEIAMLYHISEIKRASDGIEALKKVKKKYPKLHVSIFGAFPKPENLPDWFSYYRCPTKDLHNMIYNNASIFVAPSRLEGMGLTPAESMMCGAAVCCTDNPGFQIFAKHKVTALISKAMDIDEMYSNIIYLIENPNERIKIATEGHKFIQQFTWERAYSKFKSYLFDTNYNNNYSNDLKKE